MAQNAADDGNRRYVLVQLPEPLDPDNKDQKIAAEYCDEFGKPRQHRRADQGTSASRRAKDREENPMFAGDLGFRVFKLDSSNIRAWEPDRETLPKHA